METLVKHKGFIEMVARDLIRPDESQQVVKDVLEAYSKIDDTAEILVGCSTCENKFKDTFKIILAYINSGTTLTVENITETIKDGFDYMDSSFKPKKKK
jgi:trimethylamine:corrinoid methyltransferase-like protein